jgi:hypothetical protein
MNATTLSKASKFHCLRRGLPMPPDPVTAARLIPVVQTDIARHLQHQASSSTPQSGDYIEWKNILEDLQDFLADLQKLAAPPGPIDPIEPSEPLRGQPTPTSPATPNAPPLPRWERAGVRGTDEPNVPTTKEAPTTKKAPTTKEEHAAWIAAAKARCAARKQQKLEQKPLEKNSHAASASNVAPEAFTCEKDPRNTRETPEKNPRNTRETPEQDPRNTRETPELDPSQQLNTGRSRLTESQRAYLAQLLRERTAKSPLDRLSPERQQTLYEMLEDLSASIVNNMISLPEPDGWGVKIHPSSLARFSRRYGKKLEAAERAEALAEANKVLKELGPESPEFAQAIQRLLKLRCFKSALNPKSATRDLEALFRIIDRQRRTDLAERKQTLAETK